jgi:serine/threonine protein kinase
MSPQQSIAHYRILSNLGKGGMGALYRATDTRLNRGAAIKILPPAFAEDTARMQRFEREAQLPASMNHLNIARSRASSRAPCQWWRQLPVGG